MPASSARTPSEPVEDPDPNQEDLQVPAGGPAQSDPYREAVLTPLRSGMSLERKELITEARAVLGFSRTGPKLQEALGAAIDALAAEGIIGHGSSGFRLRG